MSEDDAETATSAILSADLRGAYSHGCAHVPWYVSMLLDRGVDPEGRPRVATDSGGALVVDGDNALGHIAVAFAVDQAIERAAVTGVAVAAIRHSNHCGALGYYALRAVQRNMIGIVTTNAIPTMAPSGGLDRVVGINPIAIAIPTSVEAPIVLDTSFGAAARAKVVASARANQPLPAGWALDADGMPTVDPQAALAGLIVPIGGYKGVGLAIAMGVLSTLLSGAAYGSELGDLARGPAAGRDGQFVLVLNIALFEDVQVFKSRVDGIIREIHSSRRSAGEEHLWVPGEHAAEVELRYGVEGIPTSLPTLQGLVAAGERLGLDTAAIRMAVNQATS